MRVKYIDTPQFSSTSLYVYKENGILKKFNKHNLFVVTYLITGPFLLLYRKQYFSFLVYASAVLFSYVISSNIILFAVLILILNCVILPQVSEKILINKNKMKKVKKTVTAAVLDTGINTCDEKIEGQTEETTKILLKLWCDNDISNEEVDHENYNIIYEIDGFDLEQFQEVGKKIYMLNPQRIHMDMMLKDKIQKCPNVKNELVKKRNIFLKIMSWISIKIMYLFYMMMKQEVLRTIAWYKCIDNKDNVLFCNFDIEGEYKKFSSYVATYENTPTPQSNFMIGLIK